MTTLARWVCVGSVLAGVLACGGKSYPWDPPTVTEQFEANRTTIDPGSEVCLTARYGFGTGKVEPEGVELPSGGELRVRPMATTTYTLTVTRKGGTSVQRRLTVEVRPGLKVKIKGFEGIAGPVTLSGPGGITRTLTASGLLSGLAPGDYTLTAAPVQRGATTLHPLRPVQQVHLDAGAVVTVQYLAPALVVPIPGAEPLEFVLIPAGSFLMGDDHPLNPDLFLNPSPVHRVNLPTAYYLARYLTTQGQWLALTGHNPSRKGSGLVDLEEAVASVSFESVKKHFIPELNRIHPEHRFRLPSEAEWEYACRAGTTTAYFWGEDPVKGAKFAWTTERFARELTHPVGAFPPNPWGLYDLMGLVFQWCEDSPHPGYGGAPTDGSAWLTPGPAQPDGHHIVRGYGPLSIPPLFDMGRSAARWSNYLVGPDSVGLRLVAEWPTDTH